MVTEKGSPAKYDDCEGVTTTRIGESLSPTAVKPGIVEAESEVSSASAWPVPNPASSRGG